MMNNFPHLRQEIKSQTKENKVFKEVKMKTYYDLLVELDACKEACNSRKNMTVEEAMQLAERGDWILWLASKLKLDKRKITLAKACCAKTVLHLMRDERSRNAVLVAEQYGLGKASEQELKRADTAAAAAVYAAVYAAAYAAADAAADAAAAAAVYAAAAAVYATAYAKQQSLKETAKICVEILGEDIIAEVNKRLTEGN